MPPRPIHEDFNDSYAEAGQVPSVGERETIPLEAAYSQATNTRVTGVERHKPKARKQRQFGKMLKKGTVVGASIAAAELLDRKNRRGDDTAGRSMWNKKSKLYFKALRKARKIIKDNGDLFQDGDEALLNEKPPENPPFPILIFLVAILKDLLDVLDVSLIGIIVTTLTSLCLGVILAFWVLGKASGGWWKKKLIKWLWKRYAMMFIMEMIPFFKMIPATTIFILMAHYREKKLVKVANLIFEEMHSANLMKRFS